MTAVAQPTSDGRLPTAELIALSDEPLALFDADGALAAANPAFQTLFARVSGFARVGTPWPLFLSECERHGVLSGPVCRSLELLEDRLSADVEQTSPLSVQIGEGSPVSLALVPTSDGGFAFRVQSGVDGDERDASEREFEQLMSKVLEACPASLTMTRIGDGQILYRSPAATELLGKGRNARDHFAHRAERADFLTQLLPDARVDDMRVTGRRPDGSDFPASISARLIDYRGEDVVVSTMIDLSEELSMRDALARQKEQVFQAEKMSALGELLAGVAHELNNPLSIVVGNAMLLGDEDLSPDVSRRVGKLNDAAERCVRIVRTFLSMARDRPLELVPIGVDELVAAAVDAFEADSRTGSPEIHVDVPADLPILHVDEVQIVQVLTNLLINADQAMQSSKKGNEIAISARRNSAADRITLRVKDDGPGIPADIAGRIFDPLFTTKAAGEGTGVGLALCHRILLSHGGRISLDTTMGTGAAFELELPCSDGS